MESLPITKYMKMGKTLIKIICGWLYLYRFIKEFSRLSGNVSF